jgi:hypothetical protein
MLATAVLLAACVHDTDDFNLFLAESGVSLTYYIGSDVDAGLKDHDDPWDTITEKFGMEIVHTGKKKDENVGGHDDPWNTIHQNFSIESSHTGKSGEEDPWTRIGELFPLESVYAGKSGEEDPWNRIDELFPTESVHTGKAEEEDPWSRILQLFPLESVHSGKTDNRYFFGAEKSEAVFLSFSYRMPTTFLARVVEVRGRGLKLEFTDGVEQYVIDAPGSWTEGTQLETGFVDATSKKDRPFLGVRFWRTVEGSGWASRSESPAAELPVSWPKEYQVSGANLLVNLPGGEKLHDDPWSKINELFVKSEEEHDDPWTRICSLFAKSGEEHDDPWNSIRTLFPNESVHVGKNFDKHDDPWDVINESFPLESVHTGSGKAHDDPWDRINDNFAVGSTHTGKNGASFRGHPVSRMLFVSFGEGKADDPWERIHENFTMDGVKATAELTLSEVRGRIGRFEFADGGSLFAVGVPEEWQPGVKLSATGYLLHDPKALPLAGAVVWDVDPILR